MFNFFSQTLLFVTMIILSHGAGPVKLAWGYEGSLAAENWGKSFPMCAGDTQSGIDIIKDRTVKDLKICREIKKTEWSLVETKHEKWKVKFSGSSVSYVPFAMKDGKIEYQNVEGKIIAKLTSQFSNGKDHKEFCLHSFHFHWGSKGAGGSEHNVNGLRFPLEVHFVHYSCDYANISAAIEASANMTKDKDNYVLGVVGIMFELGNANNTGFDDILHSKRNVIGKEEYILDKLRINTILPNEKDLMEFYSYKGSLTTPPCNPIVRWHVMKQRTIISPEQLEDFWEMATHNSNSSLNIAKNYRPVQKNKNTVYNCAKKIIDGIEVQKPKDIVKVPDNEPTKKPVKKPDNKKDVTDPNLAKDSVTKAAIYIVALINLIYLLL